MGSRIFDDLVDVTFTLKISQEQRRRGKRNGSGADATGTSGRAILGGDLHLEVEVNVPSPLSRLPRRVLRSSGGTLIRLVMQRMLKGFLTLLARDFERWCYNDEARELETTPEAVDTLPGEVN